ncbi:hypothetical protein [Streptomyces abikoensis]|uniref:Uncharacterized protein n=1 Tax=Streptomyces abikoensis TaxID=97398 RepID=A0ABW7T8Y6_9ACTN
MGASRNDYVNETIPPSDEKKRARLEREADALLEEAGDDTKEGWPGSWPRREESEFDRIAAAHAGMMPLSLVPLVASLPDFDPEAAYSATQDLMRGCSGTEAPDALSQILEGAVLASGYGFGFTLERRSSPSEMCRWQGCKKALNGAGRPRGAGRPSKHCAAHQKAAKARTRRLRYRGVRTGKNRNLVYCFDGLREQDLTGYRQVWTPVNTARA